MRQLSTPNSADTKRAVNNVAGRTVKHELNRAKVAGLRKE